MTDQIKTVENLLEANAVTRPRTHYLDVAKDALAMAKANMSEHVAELGRQCEARRLKLAQDQEAVKKLAEQVQADQAAGTPPS